MCSFAAARALYLAIAVLAVSSAAAVRPSRGLAVDTAATAAQRPLLEPRPTTANCSELVFEQRVDQFNFNSDAPKWQQRYFLCTQFADRSSAPILFLGERLAAASPLRALRTTGRTRGLWQQLTSSMHQWTQRFLSCLRQPIPSAAGNEAAVPKAVNTSGLLWELARDLGAVLVFAEVSR